MSFNVDDSPTIPLGECTKRILIICDCCCPWMPFWLSFISSKTIVTTVVKFHVSFDSQLMLLRRVYGFTLYVFLHCGCKITMIFSHLWHAGYLTELFSSSSVFVAAGILMYMMGPCGDYSFGSFALLSCVFEQSFPFCVDCLLSPRVTRLAFFFSFFLFLFCQPLNNNIVLWIDLLVWEIFPLEVFGVPAAASFSIHFSPNQ